MAKKKTPAKKAPAKKAKKAPAKKTEREAPLGPPLGKAVAAKLERNRKALKEYALSFPEAYEDHPWGETVAKVNKKVFVFMGHEGEGGMSYGVLGFAVKLPISGEDALELPFTEPTGYGLGKSGWVSVRFPPDEDPPMEEFRRWIDESYRAVAPKKLVQKLDAQRV